MKASAGGIALIARSEGYRAKAYKIGSDPWTIGYGETRGIGPGTAPWSESYARQRLLLRVNRDFAPAVEAFRKRHGLKWTQNQFDALVSFAYNLGTGVFSDKGVTGGTMRSALKRRAVTQQTFTVYSMPGSQFYAGLLKRRKEEYGLFVKGDNRGAKLRAELVVRRAQLAKSKDHGQRHWLMRRIRAIKKVTER